VAKKVTSPNVQPDSSLSLHINLGPFYVLCVQKGEKEIPLPKLFERTFWMNSSL